MIHPARHAMVEGWFARRGITLRYAVVGDPVVSQEWVAIMLPAEPTTGDAEGGCGLTKAAAAEDAVLRYLERHPDTVAP